MRAKYAYLKTLYYKFCVVRMHMSSEIYSALIIIYILATVEMSWDILARVFG